MKKTTYMHTEADQKKHYAHKKSAIYFASSIRTNIWYVSTLTNKYCKTGVGERKLQWSWFVRGYIAGNVFFASENTASLKKKPRIDTFLRDLFWGFSTFKLFFVHFYADVLATLIEHILQL